MRSITQNKDETSEDSARGAHICICRGLLKMNYVLHPRKTYRKWRGVEREKCIVKIDNPPMKIKGKSYCNEMECDPNHPTYFAFFGVPYATPPIGRLRFQPPQPLQVTSRRIPLLKAYKKDHLCLQYCEVCADQEIRGKEDCLYLNIYLPKKPEEIRTRLPVLVYVHGDAFHHGSGDRENVKPDAIIKQSLIFVTVNYRLNVFGFLNTGTKECSGNAGLKDQVQALKWIRANINRFGGDPNNVTISGHDAGATCVNLHLVSPLSKGLFQKAIVQSGGIYCPWGYQGDDQKPRKMFLQQFGLQDELRNLLTHILRHERATKLLKITEKIRDHLIEVSGTEINFTDRVEEIICQRFNDPFVFKCHLMNFIGVQKDQVEKLEPHKLTIFIGPSIETIKTGAFIPSKVEEMMKTAEPVTLMAGIVGQEGYNYLLQKWHRYRLVGFDELVKSDAEFVPFLMQNFKWSRQVAEKHKTKLRNRYFPNLSTMSQLEMQDRLATLNTDIWFRRFYENFKIRGKYTQFYVYKFDYLSSKDKIRWTACGRKQLTLTAPTHGDEINYLYNPQYFEGQYKGRIPSEVKRVMKTICILWGNFCKNGIPHHSWPCHTEENPCHFIIDKDLRRRRKLLFERRWSYLNSLVDKEQTVESPDIPPLHPNKCFDDSKKWYDVHRWLQELGNTLG